MGSLFALLMMVVVHGQPMTKAIPVRACPSTEEGTKIVEAVKESTGAEHAWLACVKFNVEGSTEAAPFQPQGKSV